MTPTEKQLLYCLIEECSEVIKGSTKALRFGLDDVHEDPKLPKWDLTPRLEIRHELNDLNGAVEMLRDNGILSSFSPNDRQEVLDKKVKINTMLHYSKTYGELT